MGEVTETPETPGLPDFRKVSRRKFPELSKDAQWGLLLQVRTMFEQAIAGTTGETLNFRNVSKGEWDQLPVQTQWEMFADARLALKQIYGGAATTMEETA